MLSPALQVTAVRLTCSLDKLKAYPLAEEFQRSHTHLLIGDQSAASGEHLMLSLQLLRWSELGIMLLQDTLPSAGEEKAALSPNQRGFGLGHPSPEARTPVTR